MPKERFEHDRNDDPVVDEETSQLWPPLCFRLQNSLIYPTNGPRVKGANLDIALLDHLDNQDVKPGILAPVAGERTVLPHTLNYWDEILNVYEDVIEKMSNLPNVWKEMAVVPRDVFKEIVAQDVEQSWTTFKYNPLRDSLIAYYTFNNDYIMAFPAKDSSILYIAWAIPGRFAFKVNDTNFETSSAPWETLRSSTFLQFSTPILQVTRSYHTQYSSSADIRNPTFLFGVRTAISASLVEVQWMRESSTKGDTEGQLVATILYDYVPMRERSGPRRCAPSHMTLSPFDSDEFAVMGDSGHVVVLNVKASRKRFQAECALSISEEPSYSHRWRSCLFGFHRQSLIAASSTKVEMIDCRTRQSTLLFQCERDDRIYGLDQASALSQFKFTVVTSTTIFLLDIRRPQRPVLSWSHQMIDCPPTNVEFCDALPDDEGSKAGSRQCLLYAWSSRNDRVLVIELYYSEQTHSLERSIQCSTLKFLSLESRPYGQSHVRKLGPFMDADSVNTYIRTDGIKIIGVPMHADSDNGTNGYCYFLLRFLGDGSFSILPFTIAQQRQSFSVTQWPSYQVEDDHFNRDVIDTARTEDYAIRCGTTELKSWGDLVKYIRDRYVTSPILSNPESVSELAAEQFKQMAENSAKHRMPVSLKTIIDDVQSHSNLPTKAVLEADHFLESEQSMQRLTTGGENSVRSVYAHVEIRNDAMLPAAPVIGALQDTPFDDPNLKEARIETSTIICDALSRDIQANRVTYLPLPDHDGQTKLSYLLPANKGFTLTPAARILAQEWDLELPLSAPLIFNDERVLPEKTPPLFPFRRSKQRKTAFSKSVVVSAADAQGSVDLVLPPSISVTSKAIEKSVRKRRLSATEDSSFVTSRVGQTSSSVDQEEPSMDFMSFGDISTQPVPGAFASRQPVAKKVKKKKKTKGFK
ncbi:uncharacterized protein BYT42DRAFT_553603 [Radiomyces spectabilis]|uniref:uncharacterized protein n=1 Tax=Radiomyces spectabilis TaxID=64574 RepID=UPI00221F0077|nr:uncharacterized protein BYT42DRAFT_553603 [Radiomyces spectabilis]KAI8394170.1 hypothetical protein BYT42DRAFT_553603 [Radiomyces spectabilis]